MPWESYEMAPRRLPTELGDTAVPLESASYDTLLVVEARWAHGQVGWAHNGSLETARFFFPNSRWQPISLSPAPTEPRASSSPTSTIWSEGTTSASGQM